MTDPVLKGLFRTALSDDPVPEVSADEIIARGRARRRRNRRGWTAAGGALAVAATAAAVLVASYLPGPVDGQVARPPADPRPDASVDPSVNADPLRAELWEAVAGALPEEADDIAVTAHPGELGLQLNLTVFGQLVVMEVFLQEARPDLEPLDCDQLRSVPSVEEGSCEDGRDSEDRWRVSFDGLHQFTLLEGGSAASGVTWDVMPAPDTITEPAVAESAGDPTEPAFTSEQADAVADAAWSVGAQHPSEELIRGVDLEATAANWSVARATLEADIGRGPLTYVGPGGTEPAVEITDPEHQVGTVSATYRAEDGTEVELVIRQVPRFYDEICYEEIAVCDRLTNLSYATGDPVIDESRTGRLAVGQRSAAWLYVTAPDVLAIELWSAVSNAEVWIGE
ncbi:hypothetical protein [Jiangella asiatica]|uniref:Uncharacterized protein n=1 Tax=Jiangella asiatica TaxID=2530372 RepID=A0A4R5CKJ3_9ACTN|nr:hypothetical protein [Jiangella asiatica]TDD99140.1 hypothetical protein E1269_27410 [Jiangella asiatica]